MSYTRVNWTPTTPLSDTNLNIMDNGISEKSDKISLKFDSQEKILKSIQIINDGFDRDNYVARGWTRDVNLADQQGFSKIYGVDIQKAKAIIGINDWKIGDFVETTAVRRIYCDYAMVEDGTHRIYVRVKFEQRWVATLDDYGINFDLTIFQYK